MLKEIKAERRKVVRRILKKVKPHFYESGYNKHLEPKKGIFGAKRPLLLYRPCDDFVKMRNTYYLSEFLAITEDGLITDAAGGGAFLEPFSAFPIEDLLYLEKWIDKHFEEKKK